MSLLSITLAWIAVGIVLVEMVAAAAERNGWGGSHDDERDIERR